jgi:thiosulfate dehydrogenase (quinone) large subunit
LVPLPNGEIVNVRVFITEVCRGNMSPLRATTEEVGMATASRDHQNRIPELNITRFLFADTRMAPVWLILRLWLGYEWLKAALGKWAEGGWVGEGAGGAVKGFAQGAIAQTTGEHPQVTGWYASFLENVVVPNAALFSYLVIFGETLIGIALVLGGFTGIAAFFGVFMNASFLFAGTAGANPLMALVAILIVLAWRVAGWWGLDRFILPAIGVPGAPGTLLGGRRSGRVR